MQFKPNNTMLKGTPRDITKSGDDVLIVGGGGREHAIAWKLSQSNAVRDIYAAPGNDGMCAICTGIAATDTDGILDFLATRDNIKLVVVAPDDPLAMGLVDKITAIGRRAFGPTQAAAKLEWSKAYAKDFMRRYGIPTADYETFDDLFEAKEYAANASYPLVVKADGPALGKGVIICQTEDEAMQALDETMANKKFGASGDRVVIERFLSGYELSLLAFCDGEHYSLMPTACDHKRAYDGDKGPNTGGMGAYSPCPTFTADLAELTVKTIVEPTLDGIKRDGAPFKGVLYFGLIVCDGKPYVLEYNARFGDPETQSILPLLRSDLYDIMNATIDGDLDKLDIRWADLKSVNVVLASGGYPGSYKKGMEIYGLNGVDNDINVFFAGVKRSEHGLKTNGGRVLCVQSLAPDYATALKKAYDNIAKISFADGFYRKDIGSKL